MIASANIVYRPPSADAATRPARGDGTGQLRRRDAGARARAIARAALLLGALGLAACAPLQKTDCDQLLADQKYGKAAKTCEDPSAVSMAYLGLAGFDFIRFLAAEDQNDVAGLLKLNASNVTEKRELINQAIREIYPPDTSKQAFILLLAGFLGLSVTNSEYLDNGAGGATAFDNDIAGSEVEEATGLIVESPAPAVPFDLGLSATYQMVETGQPYVVDCGADVTAPLCDDDPASTLTIYDDTLPVKGAGLDVTSTGMADPANATEVNQVTMLLDFDLPITITTEKLTRLESFLEEGTLDEDFPRRHPERFPIGVLGYLELIDGANLKLTQEAGGSAADGQPANSTLNDAVDRIRAALDNGAVCFGEAATDPVKIAAAFPLNLLYAVYRAAPGTTRKKVPGDLDFTTYNIVAAADLDTDADGNVDASAPIQTAPDGTGFAFGGGTLAMGYKVLFPASDGLGAFDRGLATPRIDQTTASFQTNFEYIPRLAPKAARALDGRVEMIEMICASNQ